MKKSLKIFLLSVVITLCSVAAVICIWMYANGWLVLGGQSGFYQGTTVNGIDISGLSVNKAQEKLEETASGYSLKIIFRDSDLSLTRSDIEMKLNPDIDIQELRDEQGQKSAADTSSDSLKIEEDDLFTYNKEAVKTKLLAAEAMDTDKMRAPENASLAYDTDAQRFILQDGDEGTTLDQEKVINAVNKTIESGISILDADKDGLYEEADLTADSDNAQDILARANAYTAVKLTYTFRDNETETIDSETIIPWIYIDDNGELQVDTDQVQELISTYAKKHNPEEGKIDFTTTSGKQIELSADSGGQTIDTNAFFDDITSCLNDGTSGNRDVPYKNISDGVGNDFGGNYIEVDLDSQILYLYKDGKKILTSDIVSGDVSKSHMTPTGVFQIFSMVRNTTLKGPGYASPVSYWMPFSGGVGLHDATWRSSFGGDIYKYNGSHGCVNMPYDNAKTVYENVSTGYYVVVYGGTSYVEGQTKENNANYVSKDSSKKKESEETGQTDTNKKKKKKKETEETKETKKNSKKKSDKSKQEETKTKKSTENNQKSVETPKTEQKTTEAPKTEQKATEAPRTEQKATEAPKTEQKATEAPKTEQKSTQAPKSDENTSEKKSEEKSEEKTEEKSEEKSDDGDEE